MLISLVFHVLLTSLRSACQGIETVICLAGNESRGSEELYLASPFRGGTYSQLLGDDLLHPIIRAGA